MMDCVNLKQFSYFSTRKISFFPWSKRWNKNTNNRKKPIWYQPSCYLYISIGPEFYNRCTPRNHMWVNFKGEFNMTFWSCFGNVKIILNTIMNSGAIENMSINTIYYYLIFYGNVMLQGDESLLHNSVCCSRVGVC